MPELNWGAPEYDFPTGVWDDFDGEIVLCEYEQGRFNTQIHVVIRPEEHEYAARGLSMPEGWDDPNAGLPHQWYSLGNQEYTISDDGMDIQGPQPQKNTRAVKFILAAREHGKLRLSGGNLRPLKGMKAHWKVVEETNRNPETGKAVTKGILYPVGPMVGKPLIGQDGSDETRGVRPFELLRRILEDAGEDGVMRRQLATLAVGYEDEFGAEVITEAVKRSTIDAAIERGMISLDGDRLFLTE